MSNSDNASRKRVLSTRKHSEEDAELFRSEGFELSVVPLLTFEFNLPDADTIRTFSADKPAGWIVTSANGARGLLKVLQSGSDLPKPEAIMAAGYKTAEPLADLEQDVLVPDTQNAMGIARYIIEYRPDLNWIHFCGNLTRPDLGRELQNREISYETVQVYRTLESPGLPETLPSAKAVLFYSPSAVEVFFNNYPGYIQQHKPASVAIGATTFQALKPYARKPVRQARQPDIHSMIAAVKRSV